MGSFSGFSEQIATLLAGIVAVLLLIRLANYSKYFPIAAVITLVLCIAALMHSASPLMTLMSMNLFLLPFTFIVEVFVKR